MEAAPDIFAELKATMMNGFDGRLPDLVGALEFHARGR